MESKHRAYTDLLAAHNEVTGSNFLLVTRFNNGKEKKIVVDLGIFQERNYEKFNSSLIFDPMTVDLAFVTHVHADHIGRLPLLTKGGYAGPIYCSEDTKTLLPIALNDGNKIQKRNAILNNKPPLYRDVDVKETLKRVFGCEYNKWYTADENTRFMLLGNGHLVGAAMILLQIHDDEGYELNLLFTGDYAPNNLFFNVPDIPEEIRKLPITIITESTYGSTNKILESEKVFEKNFLDAVNRGFSVICPCLTIERYQAMLYRFKCWQDEGKLNKKIAIHADGPGAIEITKLFRKGKLHIDKVKFDYAYNLQFVTTKEGRNHLLKSQKQKIILSPSGMGSHGHAKTYIQRYMYDPRALIHFSCYCAEGTYGWQIKNRPPKELFFTAGNGGLVEAKKANVEFTSEYSGHAKGDEILQLIKSFENAKSVVVNHGAVENKKAIAIRSYSELGIHKTGVINRSTGFRIGPDGIIETITGVTDD